VSRLQRAAALTATSLAVAISARPQAASLASRVDGLGVTARVLVIAAHPDDEDTQLITWLAKGRQVETAYLSLTRGDGGQNLIGNELGEALGAIRTEELLAARRLDGGRQYFTRAYDFGFSKSADETLTQWSRDSVLRDVVTVVRAFRPHVIVSVFSGTALDGHGHHQVAGLLAREAYEMSGDTARFPRARTEGYGGWTVSKFYRGASFRFQERATLRINVGEYDPLYGRSYAEIAAESRSQHRSQAFGVLQPRGPRFNQLMREATRVNAAQDARSEQSLFDGVDTTWARFRSAIASAERRAALDSLPGAFAAARAALDLRRPASVLPSIGRLQRLLGRVCGPAAPDNPCATLAADGSLDVRNADLHSSMEGASVRLQAALALATGVAVEATAPRELWADTEEIPVSVVAYNRGTTAVRLMRVVVLGSGGLPSVSRGSARTIAPDSMTRDSLSRVVGPATQPWWLVRERRGAMFDVPGSAIEETSRITAGTAVSTFVLPDSATFSVFTPLVHRYADPIRGEINRPIASAPDVTVTLDRAVEYAPANAALEREVTVNLRLNASSERVAEVRLVLPPGLVSDTAVRRVRLARAGDSRTVTFTVRGRLRPGLHRLTAVAISDGVRYTAGFSEIRYDHVRTQRLYRSAVLDLQAVDVVVPRGMTVAYIKGVGDNSAATLEQLGVDVTVLDPASLGRTDLSKFRTVVVGTRAYEASESLVANNARLLEYAQNGGTLVVQYGQYEMTTPGIMPYPISLGRPADRVTVEGSAVTFLDPSASVLTTPNRITSADFAHWQQDRSLYMPRSFDPAYAAFLEMNDPGEPPNRGGLLVAPYGRGTYVYTSLAFFRQLPLGVPGAARLFVNLLAARANRPFQ
jgi:LmbE family N-acetylglucosaminyl deacetylase